MVVGIGIVLSGRRLVGNGRVVSLGAVHALEVVNYLQRRGFKKGLEIYNIPEFKIHLFGVHDCDAGAVRLAFGNGVQRDDLG